MPRDCRFGYCKNERPLHWANERIKALEAEVARLKANAAPGDEEALVRAMYEAVQRVCFGFDGARLVKDVATDGMRAALAVVRAWESSAK